MVENRGVMVLVEEVKTRNEIFVKNDIFNILINVFISENHEIKMFINLNIKTLESIVRDGVKEMMSKAAGQTGAAKKKGWYKSVKEAIKEYQDMLQKEFLPTIVEDFASKIIVKFSGGKMSKEDIIKLKKFMEMLDKSNT